MALNRWFNSPGGRQRSRYCSEMPKASRSFSFLMRAGWIQRASSWACISPEPSIPREVPVRTLSSGGCSYWSFGVRAGWSCLLFLRKFVECRGYDAKGDRTLLGCSLPVFIRHGQAGIQQAYPPSAFRSHFILGDGGRATFYFVGAAIEGLFEQLPPAY